MLGEIIVKPGSTQRTKYFECATLLVNRMSPMYMMRLIDPVLIRTDDMVADALTKAIHRDKFANFRKYMLNRDRSEGSIAAMSAKAHRLWKYMRSV